MAHSAFPPVQHHSPASEGVIANDAYGSCVSWGAVIAGAFAAAALSLILLALGAGLGLSAVSPWSNAGASAGTLGKGAILWLILMEIMASSMGGYLAGRLRTRWTRIHGDEVYFRDTAHGFLSWAVGLVITAAFLASATASMVGGAPSRVATGSSSVAASATNADPNEYFIDMMLRSSSSNSNSNEALVRPEVGLIIANGLRQGDIPEADKAYLAQVVASRTGLSESEAEKRVTDVFAADQQAAESTRRAVAHSLLWIFLA
ncbi:MAG: hypothetical protein WA741_04670, partial [Candidatus Sulfotelmatobacter sp.]